jgi:hypothetical protein
LSLIFGYHTPQNPLDSPCGVRRTKLSEKRPLFPPLSSIYLCVLRRCAGVVFRRWRIGKD